jgi:hypothetical protein
MDHVQLKSYLDRFDKVLASLLPLTYENTPHWMTRGFVESRGKNYNEFDFTSAAPFAPNVRSEMLAYTLLDNSELELQFFKDPIDPKDHSAINADRGKGLEPDWTLSVAGSLSRQGSYLGRHTIDYSMNPKIFSIRAEGFLSNPRFWVSTGKIVGIPDLLGAEMFVLLQPHTTTGDPAIDQFLSEIRRGFELDSLIISISTGRELWFRKADLLKHVDTKGYPIYSFIFPKTPDGLRMLERRER